MVAISSVYLLSPTRLFTGIVWHFFSNMDTRLLPGICYFPKALLLLVLYIATWISQWGNCLHWLTLGLHLQSNFADSLPYNKEHYFVIQTMVTARHSENEKELLEG